MISATTIATLFGFILALIIVWRLMLKHRDTNHIPVLVGGLIGVALGIVVWQTIQEAATPPAPPAPDNNSSEKLVEAERQSREQVTQTLNKRIDGIANDIRSVTEVVGKLVGANLDSRVRTLEHPANPMTAPPPPPPAPKVTLSAARLIQARGAKPALLLQPQITTAPGSTIRSADISFCRVPGSADCVPAPETDHCGHSLICNGLGKFVTIPTKTDGQFCVKLQFELQDQTQGFAMGGPLQARAGADWQRDPAAPSQCDQASAAQTTVRQ